MPVHYPARRQRRIILAAALALAAAACAPGDAAQPARTDAAPPTARPAVAAVAAVSAADTAATPALRFAVAPTGNEARYRVREQLVGRDLPNDAAGRTAAVSGAIAVDSNGAVIPALSRFVVDAATLTSDRDRRDGYVRGRLLEAERYPTVTLVPAAARGFPSSLLSGSIPSGPRTFEMLGDLTVRGVTRPTTWHVTARYQGGRITGTAATAFTFEKFGLTQPRVPVVLGVADTIRLEYDFTLVADSATRS